LGKISKTHPSSLVNFGSFVLFLTKIPPLLVLFYHTEHMFD
jgi:hypothetical protein